MKIEPLNIPEVLLITPPKFGDSRGFFSGTWSSAKLAAQGFNAHFVQDNQSLSTLAGTIRGLHCQIAPSVQGKLVRKAIARHGRAIIKILSLGQNPLS
jgi:dTDP-4-dehydrorhamnose 3,5-epimerase